MHDPRPRTEAPDQLRRATRELFAAAVLFAPVPFYAVFIAGFVPLAWIAGGACVGVIRSLVNGLGEGRFLDAFILLVLSAAVVAAAAAVLYALASLICRMLFGLCSVRVAMGLVRVLIATHIIAGFFPIYVVVMDSGTGGERSQLRYLNLAQWWKW